jgi:hypothetical protein
MKPLKWRPLLFGQAVAFFALSLHGQPPPSTQAVTPPAVAPAADRPFTLARLLSNLQTIKTNPSVLNLPTLLNRVRKYGLAFQPSPDDLQKLRDKGAPEDLIKVIMEKAGNAGTPPPSPPPLKVKQGRLTVTCKPLDCAVSVDGKLIGRTTNGELRDFALLEGTATVSAEAKDHIPDKAGQTVAVKDGVAVRVDFAFKAAPNALAAKGASLLQAMLEALGGESALKASAAFSASGRLDVHTKSGAEVTWPFKAVVKLPSSALFEINRNNRKYQIVRSGSGFSWKPNPQGQDFDDLEDALHQLLDHHITRLVDLVCGSGAKAEAEKLNYGPDDAALFWVDREAYKYRITLNPESRPREIFFQSGGLNAGLRVLLSGYAKKGTVFVPMTTEVVLPGAGMRGIIVRYETLDLSPAGSIEQELKPKKGAASRGH